MNNRILILGASGFIGNALYKELLSYFDVYGTYCHNEDLYTNNKVFFKYNVEKQSILPILDAVRPAMVISSIKGDFAYQHLAHQELCLYAQANAGCRIIYTSASEVFDGKFEFPAYENDKPLSQSEFGKFKISVEKLFLDAIPKQITIVRLPQVLGINSPAIVQLRKAAEHKADFEVYPNLIITVTTVDKIAQQLHYIISKKLSGIFHLASNDMVHHEDLFKEINEKLGSKMPIFKSVYSRNDDSYLALLPKENKLPKTYRITVNDVIEASTLKEEIITLKK
ncbi:sugar nucleotide-binding protein [Constantimarinum furrinae]|uniref:dTDP-4-dehydrorhamnose reductase n=1 Tax=Constantimarinum furrinae TaxID=2562285 RepID=A0A7G8PWX9_9FLAO|nr:sugar nucleotide-binding protein [Constantimarinum furrinae]QNJ98845.1 RmlD substrate binding domain protein [Constantimarinum furrinae]